MDIKKKFFYQCTVNKQSYSAFMVPIRKAYFDKPTTKTNRSSRHHA